MAFEKGKSGNPGGRPKDTRTGLCEAFSRDLHEDWREHGKSALQACRVEEPATYVRVVAALLPKENNINVNAGESLERFIAILDRLDDNQIAAAVASSLDSEQEQPPNIRH